jgi:hypothetical protein
MYTHIYMYIGEGLFRMGNAVVWDVYGIDGEGGEGGEGERRIGQAVMILRSDVQMS